MASNNPDSTPKLKLKLSLFSLPNQPQEPPGMLTPPLRPPSSIPFLWEEAPGKPRPSTSPARSNSTLARCLELPPRLLLEAKATETADTPSPSTVLDGPYVTRSMSHSTVFAREVFDEMRVGSKKRDSGYFVGLGRKFGSMRHTRVWESSSVASPSSSTMSGGGGEVEAEHKTTVKITRMRRNGSLFRRSKSRSRTHIWASIYGTIKHAVPLPWRTKKINNDGLSI